MKKKTLFGLLFSLMLVVAGVSFTSCGDDDDEEAYIKVNGVTSTNLTFGTGSGTALTQTVKVTSNVDWQITGIPDWLSVSPQNGSGEVNITIYPKTANDQSEDTRTAVLSISGNGVGATINITQETQLSSGTTVTPTNIVTLTDGIAFDYSFGSSVSYYYRGYMEKSNVASMTESEIISVLESNFDRYTKEDDETAVFGGLDAGTTYVIYTVGYNSNGQRGKLSKTEVTTKSSRSNEPKAWITNITASGSYWNWTTTKSATCDTYYMLSTENSSLLLVEDVLIAWLIDYGIRTNALDEYLNDGSWYMAKTGNSAIVYTWGRDRNNVFAGALDWDIGFNSSSTIKKLPNKPTGKTDKNYKIPKDFSVRIFRK